MKMKYQRGGRAGKLHNMAMRIRKNKPERYNPLKENMLKLQFMEQMKLLAEQAKLDANLNKEAIETIEETIEETSDNKEKDANNE